MISRIYKGGFTLIEVIIVLAIFGVVLSAVFGSITASRNSWESARFQIDRQQEARKALDRIAWELKESCPSWNINGTLYNLTINGSGDQILFYLPVTDENNEITSLRAVSYEIGGLDNSQLLRKAGSDIVVVANNINNVIDFKPFFSFNNSPSNTIIDIAIPIIKNNNNFILRSSANLRNRDEVLSSEVTVEQILEQ